MVKIAREKFKTYKDVFDNFTLNTLISFIKKRYILEETFIPIKIGKEANVFSALTPENKRICVKIYRLETANFNKMYDYIKSEPRFSGLLNNKRKTILAWVQREFRNLKIAQVAKVNAPKAIKFYNNVLLMDFIGDEQPAQMLKDTLPKNPLSFFKLTIENMRKFYKQGFTHGDLSAYNILNFQEKPWFIDFSHSTSIKNPIFTKLLNRDALNIAIYFQKLGIKTSEKDILLKIKKNKKYAFILGWLGDKK